MAKLYLAGGRDSGWRDALRTRWVGRAEVIDPFKDCPQDYIYQFTHADLQAVAECDLLLGYCTYHRYTGLALEFGYAAALGKPIIYVPALPRVDSMMAGVSTAVFTDLDAATEFIEGRYL